MKATEVLKKILTFKDISKSTRDSFEGYTTEDLANKKALYTHEEALEQVFSFVENFLKEKRLV